jgi:chromosome segregation ATPase
MEELKNRLNVQHEKELARVQAKLVKLESTREELVKDKNEGNKELAGLKSEIRELLLSLLSRIHTPL